MEFVTETLRTPVTGAYDVIVVGGGPAGVGAAFAAARAGRSTMLVEQHGFLGGMWTAGLVIPIWDWENKGGIMQEIVDRLRAGKHTAYSGPLLGFDIEAMKYLLDRMAAESRVSPLFHTRFCAPLVRDGRVTGIVVENKSGRQAYRAAVVVDCTGDGDVAARAGAPFRVGRESDGAKQPMSMMFKLGNMDYVQAMDYFPAPLDTTELFYHMQIAAQRAGLSDYPFNFTRPYILRLPTQHQGIAEMTHVRGKNPLDAWSLTEAELEGRALVQEAMRFFTQYMPQFEHAFLEQTAPHIGIRESRRILGGYVLSLRDILEGSRFPDGVCTCAFNVDIHQPDGLSQEGHELRNLPYQIPYRCLVPQSVDGLLVAGRCISGTYEAHASYRVTGDCVATGQAAGTAAALSVEAGCQPRDLDGGALVRALERAGVTPQ